MIFRWLPNRLVIRWYDLGCNLVRLADSLWIQIFLWKLNVSTTIHNIWLVKGNGLPLLQFVSRMHVWRASVWEKWSRRLLSSTSPSSNYIGSLIPRYVVVPCRCNNRRWLVGVLNRKWRILKGWYLRGLRKVKLHAVRRRGARLLLSLDYSCYQRRHSWGTISVSCGRMIVGVCIDYSKVTIAIGISLQRGSSSNFKF